MTRILKYALIALLAINVSCDDDEDECDVCGSALSHMASKLKANGCNPNFMQEAWDRIKDDCGGRSGDAVGYMAENCTFNYNGSLRCIKEASGLAFIDDHKRPIRLNYSNALPADSLLFILSHFQNYSFGDSHTLFSNQSAVLEYTGSNDFGSTVYIAVLRVPSMDTIATEKETFSYNRTNNWDQMREVNITYDQGLQGYTVALDDW